MERTIIVRPKTKTNGTKKRGTSPSVVRRWLKRKRNRIGSTATTTTKTKIFGSFLGKGIHAVNRHGTKEKKVH